MSKLKPCPFCGDKNVQLLEDKEDDRIGVWFVTCNTDMCPCNVRTGNFYNTDLQAIQAWNKRANKSIGLSVGKIENVIDIWMHEHKLTSYNVVPVFQDYQDLAKALKAQETILIEEEKV